MLPLDYREPDTDLTDIGNKCELIRHSKILEKVWTCCWLPWNKQEFNNGEYQASIAGMSRIWIQNFQRY